MPSRSLYDCSVRLAEAWKSIERDYAKEHPGKALLITCTYRSPAEQQALYAQGRSKPGAIVTHLDGAGKLSNHNHSPSRALDFAVLVGGKVTWQVDEYLPVGEISRRYGLVWGGDWTWKDYPHIELPKKESGNA